MVTVLGRERDGTTGSQQEIIQVRNISIPPPPISPYTMNCTDNSPNFPPFSLSLSPLFQYQKKGWVVSRPLLSTLPLSLLGCL